MNRSAEQVWDEYLVLHAQAGDVRAMRRLLQRHQAPLQRYLLRLMGNHTDVLDVLQESLLACSRQLHSLRDPALFRAWLYGIATRQCRTWQRKHYRDKERHLALDHSEVLQAEIAQESDGDTPADVHDVMTLLNPDERALLSLFYLQGFSIRELVTVLGISVSAVKTRLFRARASFERHWHQD